MKDQFRWVGQSEKTLFDPFTGQNMHSEIGATEESKLIFFEGSRIATKLMNSVDGDQPFRLWDVGLGFGMNAVQVWDFVNENSGLVRRPLIIESFETRTEGLEYALNDANQGPVLFQKWSHHLRQLLEKGSVTAGPHQWRLHQRDFYEPHPVQPKADVIFYDLYCPKIDSTLWNTKRFHYLYQNCNGVLVTYSAATWVRTNLIFAGFHVGHGPGTPMKLESTCAWVDRKMALEDHASLLSEKWLSKVRRSSKAFSQDYAGIDFQVQYNRLLDQDHFKYLKAERLRSKPEKTHEPADLILSPDQLSVQSPIQPPNQSMTTYDVNDRMGEEAAAQ